MNRRSVLKSVASAALYPLLTKNTFGRSIYPLTPYLYTPSPYADNGPQIKALLESGYRWIKIDGTSCPIWSRLDLGDSSTGDPYDGLIIEPADGIDSVNVHVGSSSCLPQAPPTIVSAGAWAQVRSLKDCLASNATQSGGTTRPAIARDRAALSSPDNIAFGYELNERRASYLTQPSGVNSLEIFVADVSQYSPGDWVFISDLSINPSSNLSASDGPMEARQVIGRRAGSLVLDRVLKTAHPQSATVSIFKPIRNLIIRGLEFSGNCTAAIHLHGAQHCIIENISSSQWTGFALVVLDNAGSCNLLKDVYCTGTAPIRISDSPEAANQNGWGVAMEGQDSTVAVNCGGEHCSNGILMNYCIDTIATDARAHLCNVNVNVNFRSLRSGFIRPHCSSSISINTLISDDCVDCFILNPGPYI